MTPPSRAWLKPFLEPLKPIFREVLAMSLFVNLLALAVPVFTLQVYDRVIASAGISTLWGLAIGMIFVIIFDYILRMARSRIMQSVALRVDVLVGQRLFDKLMGLPLHMLESKPANHWQSLFRDVYVVRNTLSGASALLVADLPFAVVFLGVILVIVQTDKNYLGEEEGSLPIVPGMQATVDIHTGKKSVMDYLIRPILKLRHEAFRER